MKQGKKLLLGILAFIMLIQVTVATLAIELTNSDLGDAELNEEAGEEEELALLLESFGMNEVPAEFSIEFSGLDFEELMEAISDELLEILYRLGIEFNTLIDFEQLQDIDEEMWTYIWEQSEAIFWEFYQLVLAFTPDEEADKLEIETELDVTDTEDESDEGEGVEDLETDVRNDLTLEYTEKSEQAIGLMTQAEVTSTNPSATQEITTMRRTGVTVSNNVNFRRGPGTNYGTMSRIPVNTNVRMTGRHGNWYRIVHHGTTGWVKRSQVEQTRQIAIVSGNNVPVRYSSSSDARILTRATRGTRVVITQRTAGWARVTVNRRTGWVRTSQLNIANGRRPGRTRRQMNLHSRPDASSAVRRRLSRHQDFMILQRTVNGSAATQGWTQVMTVDAIGTHIGWIRTNQVQTRNQARRTRGRGNVAVRTGPGTKFRVRRRIPRNTRVTVLAESGNWSHVRFSRNGRRHEGWIASSSLAKIHPRVTTLTRGDSHSYLALVNRDFRLARHFAPNDMRVVNVRSVNGTHRLRRTAAGYAESLFRDARRSGHTLIATSGFRSYATQRTTHNHWINVLGLARARRVSAQPGHSEHQLGLALDISSPRLGGELSEGFSSTPEGRWLRNNAHRYGFIIRYPRNREADTGFAYEPWHIRFVGVDAATEIFNRGFILEEFLGH